MTQAIAVIRKEHQNMTRLLDLLDRQIDLIENAVQPDYELIKEIVDYFLTFPDLYHHPKEDLIFRKIKRRAPDLAADLFDLEAEHEKVSDRLHTFTKTLVNVMLEAEVPRDSFVGIAREFIDGERQHMADEEKHFFRLALDTLSEKDWVDIDAAIANFNDPLDAEPSLRFRSLDVHLNP